MPPEILSPLSAYFMLKILLVILQFKLLWQLNYKFHRNLGGPLFPCIAYSNHNSSFGCSSKFYDNDGEIIYLEDVQEFPRLEYLKKNSKYIIAIMSHIFNNEFLQKIPSDSITGVVVLYTEMRPKDGSYENKMPKDKTDTQTDSVIINGNYWNKNGQNLILQQYGFPIVMIKNQTEIQSIKTCYQERNVKAQHPKCGLKISTFMRSYSMNSKQCMHKNNIEILSENPGFCGSVVAQNIYAHFPIAMVSQKYIVISTKLDIRCFFRDACNGAQSESVSITILLAVIKLLGDHKAEIKNESNYNLLFIGFDGESWDNVGSSIFAFDLSFNKTIPIKELSVDKIEYWIELGSLGSPDLKYYIHADNKMFSDPNIKPKIENISNIIIKKFKENSLVATKSYDSNESAFPFCSLKEIYRHNLKIPGIYISDFNFEYTNKFYHGIYDDINNVDMYPMSQSLIQRLANLTHSLLSVVNEFINIKNLIPDKNLIQAEVLKLAKCLLNHTDCSIMSTLEYEKPQTNDQANRFSRETGVSDEHSLYLDMLSAYIGYQLGSIFNKSDKECAYGNPSLTNFKTANHCVINASLYLTHNASLFFKDYDLYKNYSSWTLSYYDFESVQIYYIKSGLNTIYEFIFGISVSGLCMFCSYYLMTREHKFLRPIATSN